MGIYLNPGNSMFRDSVEMEIYVDKTFLIRDTWLNKKTKNKYVCISRPRRFGKSTDIHMLSAFFSRGCDSDSLFQGLNIAEWEEYRRHLNRHNVIKLNMQEFISKTKDVGLMIDRINSSLLKEVRKEIDESIEEDDLVDILNTAYAATGESFIFLIDEWDCIFREFKGDLDAQKQYLDYLRLIFKDQPYIELVYMTGILPIKKYGTHSALNMFDEISMVECGNYSCYMGFTDAEVQKICEKYGIDYDKMHSWYDGYRMRDGISTYSPRSVTAAVYNRDFSNYWTQTETFEALREYIDLNYDGLKDDVVKMLSGGEVHIDTLSFQNDMTSFHSKDDIFTLLVHLGYLSYSQTEKCVQIPNYEVKNVFVTSIKNSDWGTVSKMFRDSNELLDATIAGNADKVAAMLEQSHYVNSQLKYNDENSLACSIMLAYITASQHYNLVRELPTGKGFADIVFLPKKGSGKPAMIVELKYDKDAESGIRQIKDRKYYLGLQDYTDDLLLVAVNYDKDTKEHSCIIEQLR